jgi:hypothetical protein
MTRISSLQLAAAVGGTAALVKVLALAVAFAVLAVGAADAGNLGRACTAAAQAPWSSSDAVRAKLEVSGYALRGGKIKKACVLPQEGQVEAFVDPTDRPTAGKP